MLPKRVTVQLLAFLVLSGGVAANVFLFQSSNRGGPGGSVFDANAWNIAAIEAAEFGDTGSIHRQASTAGGLDLSALAVDKTPPPNGDTGKVVLAVQRELQIRGYETGGRDGVVGAMTRGAIMAFEHDHGLPLTGRPTDELLKAIVLGTSGKPGAVSAKAGTAEAQEVIRNVQQSLAKLGYKAGAVSGKLTPETARAIRAFEADQALPESGRISGPLIARLGRLAGSGRVAAAP
ncbi:MAG: peptidoglycan-binding domain-containing protein [Hyphomicrobium sp.]|jgi:peptidoglycan hydrolase-like protein with peptidoglycan-binding domain